MSSLSSVVSNLVRAQMGTTLGPTVKDEDLDRHVAELILKEAKQKPEKYGQDGIRAYLQSNFNAPKTNKRFLSSIIKNTDDHNKTILRAQAQAAQELRIEREEQERRERKARAEEAVAAERMRRLVRQGGRTEWASNWDRSATRDRKRRERSCDDAESGREHKRERRSDRHDRERHHRHRSPSREPRRRGNEDLRSRRTDSRDRHHDEDDEDHGRHRHRRRHREPSPSRTSTCSEDGLDERDHSRHRRRHRRETDTHRKSRHISPPGRNRTRSPDAGRPSRSRQASPVRSDDTTPQGSQRWKDVDDDDEDLLSREEKLRLEMKRRGQVKATEEDIAEPYSRQRSPSQRTSHTRQCSPSHRTPPPREHKAKSRSHDVATKSGSTSSRTLRSSASPARSSVGPPSPPASSPPPLPPLPSKMDKYFESSYDPRLDVAPLAVPSVPKTGLIDDADFAGWEAMLEVIRQQREYKAEKKMLERWGGGKDKDKDKRKKGADAASLLEAGSSVMDIQYKKRGAVREWDLGKEGF